jgi:hypothetical protein
MKRWAFLAVIAVFVSCSSIPWTSSMNWDRGKVQRASKDVTIALGTVSVDKALGAASVQAELVRVAELFILEQGYKVAQEGEIAPYRLELQAVEREYIQGWQNQRSIAIDAWLWDQRETSGLTDRPMAVGRAVSVGTKSLASSRDLEGLLRRALKPLLGREPGL